MFGRSGHQSISEPPTRLNEKIRQVGSLLRRNTIAGVRKHLNRADVNSADTDGWTPLNLAISRTPELEKMELIETVLLYPHLDVNLANSTKNPDEFPLMLAVLALYDHPKMKQVVRQLLELGANPHKPGNKGVTPTHLLLYMYDLYPRLVHMALQGATITPAIYHIALHQRSSGALRYLLGHFDLSEILTRADDRGRTPLQLALSYGTSTAACLKAKLLMDAGYSYDESDPRGHYPIHLAVEYQNVRFIKICLQKTKNLNVTNRLNQTAIMCAIDKIRPTNHVNPGDTNMIFAFRDCSRVHELSWDVLDINGNSVYSIANQNDSERTFFEWFLKMGLDPNMLDGTGRTPLMLLAIKLSNNLRSSDYHERSSYQKMMRLIDLMLSYGANPDYADLRGVTPRALLDLKEASPFLDNLIPEEVMKAMMEADSGATVEVEKKKEENGAMAVMAEPPLLDFGETENSAKTTEGVKAEEDITSDDFFAQIDASIAPKVQPDDTVDFF